MARVEVPKIVVKPRRRKIVARGAIPKTHVDQAAIAKERAERKIRVEWMERQDRRFVTYAVALPLALISAGVFGLWLQTKDLPDDPRLERGKKNITVQVDALKASAEKHPDYVYGKFAAFSQNLNCYTALDTHMATLETYLGDGYGLPLAKEALEKVRGLEPYSQTGAVEKLRALNEFYEAFTVLLDGIGKYANDYHYKTSDFQKIVFGWQFPGYELGNETRDPMKQFMDANSGLLTSVLPLTMRRLDGARNRGGTWPR